MMRRIYLSDPDPQLRKDTGDALDGFLHEIKVVADRAHHGQVDYFHRQHHESGDARDSASELDDSDPGSELVMPSIHEYKLINAKSCSPDKG